MLQALCTQQPVLLHDHFTKAMEDWELEFESLKWYQFIDTTCLFVAAAYRRAERSDVGPCDVLQEDGTPAFERCKNQERRRTEDRRAPRPAGTAAARWWSGCWRTAWTRTNGAT